MPTSQTFERVSLHQIRVDKKSLTNSKRPQGPFEGHPMEIPKVGFSDEHEGFFFQFCQVGGGLPIITRGLN
jgi:hypothetical protein